MGAGQSEVLPRCMGSPDVVKEGQDKEAREVKKGVLKGKMSGDVEWKLQSITLQIFPGQINLITIQ